MSSPNQRVVQIEKPKYEKNFLQIGEDEWTEAFTRLKPSAFGIYLYLANNANGYKLELSQKAVENKLGIKKSTYHEAVAQLEKEGYLYSIKGNLWGFRTKSGNPDKLSQTVNDEVQKSGQVCPEIQTIKSRNPDLEVRKSNIQIDNKYIDNIDIRTKKGIRLRAEEDTPAGRLKAMASRYPQLEERIFQKMDEDGMSVEETVKWVAETYNFTFSRK